MAVYRIKGKQRGPWCSFCPPKTTRATLRGFMWGKCSCSDHEVELRKWDERETAPDYSEAAFNAGLTQ